MHVITFVLHFLLWRLFSIFLSYLSVSAPPPPLPPSIYPNKSHLCPTDATFHWSIKAEFLLACLVFFCFSVSMTIPAIKLIYCLAEICKCLIKDNAFISSHHLVPHGFNNFSRKLHNVLLALALLAAADYVLTFHHHYLNLNYFNKLEHRLFHCCKICEKDYMNLSLKDSQQSKPLCIVCVRWICVQFETRTSK